MATSQPTHTLRTLLELPFDGARLVMNVIARHLGMPGASHHHEWIGRDGTYWTVMLYPESKTVRLLADLQQASISQATYALDRARTSLAEWTRNRHALNECLLAGDANVQDDLASAEARVEQLNAEVSRLEDVIAGAARMSWDIPMDIDNWKVAIESLVAEDPLEVEA